MNPTSHVFEAIPNSSGNDRFAPLAPVLSQPLTLLDEGKTVRRVRNYWTAEPREQTAIVKYKALGRRHGSGEISNSSLLQFDMRTRDLSADVILVVVVELFDVLEGSWTLCNQGTLLEFGFLVLQPVLDAELGDLLAEVRLGDPAQGVDNSDLSGQILRRI